MSEEDVALSVTHRDAGVEWKIKEFISLPKEANYYIESPTFSLSRSKWYIQIRPNGETRNQSEGWVGLFVFKNVSREECSVGFTVGFKKDDGSRLVFGTLKNDYGIEESGLGLARCLERSALESSNDILDSDGSLTIFCTVRIVSTKEVESQTTSSPYDIPTLAEDLKRVYIDKLHTDITIKVNNKELPAHKFILAARSNVFAAMFQHDMAEKYSGIVEIDDIDSDSFEDFIMYLYTGKLDLVTSSNAISLFKAADKYGVAELRKECVQTMIHKLNVESFCYVVQLAIIHEYSDLLTAATSFFFKNMKAIWKTPEWQEFLNENPTYANDLVVKALDNAENK